MFYSKSTKGFYTLEIHGSNIPSDAVEVSNDHYLQLMKQQQEGLEIVANNLGYPIAVTPEPTPVQKPQSVTMRQARLALYDSNLLDQVSAAIANDPRAQIEWEYATTVERNSQLVQTLATGLGLTEQQLDELFILAATV